MIDNGISNNVYLEEKTMNKETLSLLAKYNSAANEKMNAVISTLSGAEWERELGGFFKSIRGLCSHIYLCDYIWMKRFHIRAGIENGGGFFTEDYHFMDSFALSLDEYLAKRPEMDEKISAFINVIDDAVLAETLKYANSKGVPMEKRFGGLFLHLFNHHTHHRGMISLCLELLGRENDFSPLHTVL
jgi:uncharacterized damage-inducible protein DinB